MSVNFRNKESYKTDYEEDDDDEIDLDSFVIFEDSAESDQGLGGPMENTGSTSSTLSEQSEGLWSIVTDFNKLRKYWFEILAVVLLLLMAWIWGLPLLEYYLRLGKRLLYLLSFFIPVLALWGFNKVNKDRVVRTYNQNRFSQTGSGQVPGPAPGIQTRNVSGSMKKYVAANQKWFCALCGDLLDASYEVDHKIPLYRGGSNTVENLQALCRNCHGKKTIQDAILG